MSISENDTGKIGGAVIGSAGVGGAAAESGNNINLLIIIGAMAIIATGFYWFVKYQANKEKDM